MSIKPKVYNIARLGRTFNKQLGLQLMVLIGMGFIIFFNFVPFYGIQLAFKELMPAKGIWGSPWVGLKHFRDFINSMHFSEVMTNTIGLSFLKILFAFPAPIIFALLLSEIKSYRGRSLIQGVTYIPHFLSWVIFYGVVASILARDGGSLNSLLLALGIIKEPIHFLASVKLFWPLMILLDIVKETGWSTILYMAAIAGVDPQLFEAARVDGASRFKQILHITLPGLIPLVVTLLILRVGSILNAGFDELLVFRNNIVFDKANIIDIYVMDTGLVQGRFGYATAVGLFKSAIGFILVYSANKLASKFDQGLW
jgi:putative aldouronate transport system permease protein